MTVHVLRPPFSLHPLMKEANRRTRQRRVRLTIAALVVGGLAAGLAVEFHSVSAPVAAPKGPIRVTLTAKNHAPHPSESPNWHWWYSVKVLNPAGKPVPAHIHLQILSGRTPVEGVALISLTKGLPAWRAAIGGEANVLAAAPRGQKLLFEAVVRAKGVTVRRFWPIVVR